MTRRPGDVGSASDGTAWCNAGSTRTTPTVRRKAAITVASMSLDASPDRPAAKTLCRELLDALGLAPTTPTGGTR